MSDSFRGSFTADVIGSCDPMEAKEGPENGKASLSFPFPFLSWEVGMGVSGFIDDVDADVTELNDPSVKLGNEGEPLGEGNAVRVSGVSGKLEEEADQAEDMLKLSNSDANGGEIMIGIGLETCFPLSKGPSLRPTSSSSWIG